MKQIIEQISDCLRYLQNRQMLDIRSTLKKRVSKDQYFTCRKLYPNIDFYTGIIHNNISIPISMLIIFFAV